MIRGRLAPSPTGAQHLGNARTHLIAYWATRQAGGELVLRIDDLDSPRVKDWAVDQATEDIRWLGIDWDDGPSRQTKHQPAYQQALDQLTTGQANLAYPCYCSRKDIAEALSAPHETRFRGEGPLYPGTCAGWKPGDPIRTQDHCWRFRTSDNEVRFDDLVLGPQVCHPATELGDFPITSKNGQATYQLAVVVDDVRQGVNQVVRGNDLVASTFRQLELYKRLGHSVPEYAHVPLVCGLDGRRLAKRHGDTRLSFYREQGVSPQRIVGWAAHSLGLIDQPEPCQAAELVDQFDWSLIRREDTRIDSERLFLSR
ncbi:tRNA glutamyl-Q(34) synthetase GluQRS [Stieleria sp. TO1_6]|uniref:tRNA glutamyl-Q(34) synthetase GluQRS n=1 Tax=Stieleria tagensis TaxID=2956795 RepID=UPI00209ADB18|nr:tRNA glutamyl-Q(34) synthetase GluQRS [Stieleria tagensis]MCO8125145.1 tRNA glutamyl-Q(34) synthetase GluQRS [Stieleria tagensis]